MNEWLRAEIPIFQGVEKINNERREKKNMKHCFTWIGLICLVMFSVNASATTPFADDLPDIRLAPTGSGSLPTTIDPAFDLDDYVIDNDTADDSLTWQVSGEVSVDLGGPVVNIDGTLHDVEILGMSSAGLYDATFTVSDSEATRAQASTIKYSTFFVTEPSFTADNRLVFKGNGVNVPRFTYVKLFDGSGSSEGTPALDNYLFSDLQATTPFSAVTFPTLIAHDLSSGAPVEVARGQSIDVLGGLEAEVLTPSGVVWLTPTGALSCAVLISIPAVLETDFDRSSDWDGAVIMVAPAKSIKTYPAWTGASLGFPAPDLAQTARFENIPSGAPAEVDGPGTNTHNAFITGGLRLSGVGIAPLGTIKIISASTLASEPLGVGTAAKQFPGATSGNVLVMEHDHSGGTVGDKLMITTLTTYDITPALPGMVFGISMNIATDIPSSQAADFRNNVEFLFQVQSKPDFGIYVQSDLGRSTEGTGFEAITLPTDGKWRQMYFEFTVPDLNQSVDGSLNFSKNGFLTVIRSLVSPGTPAFNVYLDNLYIYCKGMSEINVTDANDFEGSGGLVEVGLANGITAIPVLYNQQNGDVIEDMGFDNGSTIQDNNWRLIGTGKPGTVKAADWTGADGKYDIAAGGRQQTAGSLKLQVPGGLIDSDSNDGIRVASRPLSINGLLSSGAQIPDAQNRGGASYYGVSFWLRSDAGTVTDNPELRLFLQEIRPSLNQVFTMLTLGPTCLPVDGDDWVQYSLVGAFPELGLGPAMGAALLQIDFLTMGYRINNIWANFPAPYNTVTTAPGADGSAPIYIDDMVVHKVDDIANYWNYSLFD